MQVLARLPVARALRAAPLRASAARAAPRAARRGLRVRAEAVEEEMAAGRGAEDSIGMGVMEDIMKSAAGARRHAPAVVGCGRSRFCAPQVALLCPAGCLPSPSWSRR
jgi:hypothetical protein